MEPATCKKCEKLFNSDPSKNAFRLPHVYIVFGPVIVSSNLATEICNECLGKYGQPTHLYKGKLVFKSSRSKLDRFLDSLFGLTM